MYFLKVKLDQGRKNRSTNFCRQVQFLKILNFWKVLHTDRSINLSNSSKNTALLNEKRFSRCVVLLSVFITMALITGIFIISSAQNGMENKTRVTKIRSIGKKTCCFIVSVTVIFTTCVLKAYFKNINNSFEIGLKFLVFAVIPICKAYARREKQFFFANEELFHRGLTIVY